VRMPNSPGESIAFSSEFLNLLDRLDVCLEYLKANVCLMISRSSHDALFIICLQRLFKDAEIYLIRFQHCLTRSMTLIKMYFINTINALGQEVTQKTANKVSVSFLFLKFSSKSSNRTWARLLSKLCYTTNLLQQLNQYGF